MGGISLITICHYLVLIHLRETEMSPSENFSPPPKSEVLDIDPSLHLHMVKMAPLPSF